MSENKIKPRIFYIAKGSFTMSAFYIKESAEKLKWSKVYKAIEYSEYESLESLYNILIADRRDQDEQIKELKQENAKLKNTNDSLLAENNMFIKSLENIIRDDFVADYQSELHRVIRIAREALGAK